VAGDGAGCGGGGGGSPSAELDSGLLHALSAMLVRDGGEEGEGEQGEACQGLASDSVCVQVVQGDTPAGDKGSRTLGPGLGEEAAPTFLT
jgi:hypothetical protein